MAKYKIPAVFISCCLLLHVGIPALAESATVTGEGVNVRTGPGTMYGTFASLDEGAEVEVVSRSNPDWYLVSWDGNSGYVAADFLDVREEAPAPAAAVVSMPDKTAYISGMYVCLRSGPDTSSDILGTYSTGQEVTVTGSSGDWTAVRIGNKSGYVFSDFVSENNPNTASIVSDPLTDAFGGIPVSSSPENGVSASNGSTIFIVSEDSSPLPDVSVPESTVIPVANAVPVSSSTPVASLPEPVAPVADMARSPTPSSSDAYLTSGSDTVGSGEIVGNAVRLRSGPGTTYPIIESYDQGTPVRIFGSAGDWTQVTIQDESGAQTGYIHSDYIRSTAAVPVSAASVPVESSAPLQNAEASVPSAFKAADGYIVASSVRLREAPSMSAKILAELNFGTAVRMTGVSGDWTKVICKGQEGFVSSAFVTEGVFEPASGLSKAVGADLGKEIAAYALKYLNYPYKWGGNSPTTGFDCSGFVQYIFSQFGYTTSRVANDVLTDGVHVDPADIQPGDVLCFYSGNNYVGHVGIYIGDNMFVHAANSAIGVVTTDLSTGYYSSRGYEIRRII